MKKVLVKAYLCNNLGDDLFVYILVKRYKNNFYTYSANRNSTLKNFDNLIYKKNIFNRLIDKIMFKIFKKRDFTENISKKKYDLLIYIGGSIFIQNEKLSWNNMKTWKREAINYFKNKIPYYIIGCNFGPWQNDDFISLVRDKIFNGANDVCFRDKKSFDIFKDDKNIRVAPDIVFGLKKYINFDNNPSEKRVVFSIIDAYKKVDRLKAKKYESKIIEMIEYFSQRGYKITLISFCKFEGDEIAINRIIEKFGNDKKVDFFFYKGNIEETLKIIAKSSIIVGTRFHANVIGISLGKYIIPIAYSDKLKNTLKDLNFKGKIFDINNIEEINIDNIMNHITNYKIDMDIDGEGHFKKLDEILEKNI